MSRYIDQWKSRIVFIGLAQSTNLATLDERPAFGSSLRRLPKQAQHSMLTECEPAHLLAVARVVLVATAGAGHGPARLAGDRPVLPILAVGEHLRKVVLALGILR